MGDPLREEEDRREDARERLPRELLRRDEEGLIGLPPMPVVRRGPCNIPLFIDIPRNGSYLIELPKLLPELPKLLPELPKLLPNILRSLSPLRLEPKDLPSPIPRILRRSP